MSDRSDGQVTENIVGLDWRARRRILKGDYRDRREAEIALEYGKQLHQRAAILAFIGAMSALVVAMSLALLFDGGLTTGSMVLAFAIAIGTGVGYLVVGRRRAGRIQHDARQALAGGGV